MLSVCQTEIVYRHKLPRLTTQKDMDRGVGGREFEAVLKKYKWISSDNTALRSFQMEHNPGIDYVEWRAYIQI